MPEGSCTASKPMPSSSVALTRHSSIGPLRITDRVAGVRWPACIQEDQQESAEENKTEEEARSGHPMGHGDAGHQVVSVIELNQSVTPLTHGQALKVVQYPSLADLLLLHHMLGCMHLGEHEANTPVPRG